MVDLLHEPLRGELRFWDYREDSKMGVGFRISCLVVVGGTWPRNDDSGLAHSGKLGQGRGASATDHEVSGR